jgi:uncharacterized protein (DUF1697 family)
MTRFVALLRAINAGRGRTVKMGALRRAFESVGFTNVETFIASGNVIFESKARKAALLEKKIEKALHEKLRIEVETFVRSPRELAKVAARHPFPKSKLGDGAEINIIFLGDELDEERNAKLKALTTETDEFRVRGREIYWLRRRKPGGPAFSTVPLEKVIKAPFTVRSARTVERMAEKHTSSDD